MAVLDATNTDFLGTLEFEGLPSTYPVPHEVVDLMFYIQRNQNRNTVIYQLNRNLDGSINQHRPLNVFWKDYEKDGSTKKINLIQKKLAYGYESKMINDHTFQIQIVSYPSYKIYITRIGSDYKAVSKFEGVWTTLNNIYVYAEESGAFPIVKHVEIYGQCQKTSRPKYEIIYKS